MGQGTVEIIRNFDLTVTENKVAVSVLNYHVASVQVKLVGGAWSSGVLTWYKANDPAYPVAFSPGLAFSSDDISAATDCTGFAWLVGIVTTVSGGGGIVDIMVCAKDGEFVPAA